MRTIMTRTGLAILVIAITTAGAEAQTWTGGYLGGAFGAGWLNKTGAETVEFDTNLDGDFNDTVRTGGGAEVFSPGFCQGMAVGSTPSAGCTDDENGMDFGGRAGYDWQSGSLVAGVLVDVFRTDVTDHVTAFSTTPAFYSFSRKLKAAAGFRGRVGLAMDRLLVYGTGGPALARIGQRFATSNSVNTFVAVNQDDDADADDDGFVDATAWGYQLGGGAEYRLTPTVTVIGEYLFSSVDNRESSTVRAQGPAPAANPFIVANSAGTELRRSGSLNVQALRVGLNVRF